jgi:hypothetical protein
MVNLTSFAVSRVDADLLLLPKREVLPELTGTVIMISKMEVADDGRFRVVGSVKLVEQGQEIDDEARANELMTKAATELLKAAHKLTVTE